MSISKGFLNNSIDQDKVSMMAAYIEHTFDTQELLSLGLMLQGVFNARKAEERSEMVRFMEERGLG